MDVLQTTQRTAIDWNTFNIGSQAHVHFQQPSGGVALNRVLDTNASQIYGRLTSTGQVFLLNPNGVLFAPGAQVDVGGIVASTLNLSNADFMAGNYRFEGASSNAIVNQGNITARGDGNGGTIALIAAKITNDGTLTAEKGNILLGAGSKVTLDMGGPVKLQVENDALETLIQNGGAIKADGGRVLLTSKAANALTSSVINNTGVIEAQTLATGEKGEIILFAHDGHMNVGGTIKAVGGFVETSGKTFSIAEGAEIKAGEWLIDPVNITIGSTLAGSIAGALNAGGDVTISTAGSNTPSTASGESGSDGDITVSSGIAWSTAKTLTLHADRNIQINADITASNATGKLSLLYGQSSFASGNTSNYYIAYGNKVTLQAGSNFSTKQGSDGATINWTVITGLGAAGDQSDAGATNSLQGIGYSTRLAGNFVLGAEISNGAGTATWNTNAGFMPIGYGFTGKLDGLGHTISGLTIDRTSTDYVGLFSTVSTGAVIRNLHLTGASIKGKTYVGGIAASLSGATIENVSSSGVIQGTSEVGGIVGSTASATLENVSSSASVSIPGSNFGAGGLVGRSNALTIKRSFSTGSVTGGGYAGGLVGYTVSGAINLEDSYSTGTVTASAAGAGGLVGAVTGGSVTITRSYAVGAHAGAGANKGGLVGQRSGGGVSYVNSFWDSQTTGQSTTATDSGTTTTGATTTADLKKASTLSGWNTNIVEDSSIPLGSAYPQLRWKATGVGAGSSTWVIGPSGTPVTYTFSSLTGTYTYNGNPYSLTNLWSASSLFGNTYSGWVLGTDYNFKHSGATVTNFTNAGTYSSITVDILKSGFIAAASGNTAGSFTIAKAPLTVTANNATATYNGSAYTGTPGVAYSGFVTPTGGSQQTSAVLGGTLAYAYSTANPTNAASYTITPSGLTAANYNITYNSGTLTIDKKALTVTGLTAGNKMYDGATTASVTGTAAISGVVGSDSGSVGLTGTASGAFANANVGTAKPVTVTGLTLTGGAAGNYSLTTPAGFVADITQRPITVTADAKSKTYGETDPTLTWQVTSGNLVGSDSLTGALTRTAGENANSYTIDASALANGNYLITKQNGALTISQRPIKVTADAKSKTYGEADPALSVSISSTAGMGLAASDVLAEVTGALSRETGETAGSYDVRLGSGAKAANYAVSFASDNNALTINANSTMDTVVASAQTVPGVTQNNGAPAANLNPVAPPPVSVVSNQGPLPVMNVSGGLAFVAVAPSGGQSGSSTTTMIQSVADLPKDSMGRDALGFMRVFVIGGGVNGIPLAAAVQGQANSQTSPQ
jgi:filamentous hemagglutinin family protein